VTRAGPGRSGPARTVGTGRDGGCPDRWGEFRASFLPARGRPDGRRPARRSSSAGGSRAGDLVRAGGRRTSRPESAPGDQGGSTRRQRTWRRRRQRRLAAPQLSTLSISTQRPPRPAASALCPAPRVAPPRARRAAARSRRGRGPARPGPAAALRYRTEGVGAARRPGAVRQRGGLAAWRAGGLGAASSTPGPAPAAWSSACSPSLPPSRRRLAPPCAGPALVSCGSGAGWEAPAEAAGAGGGGRRRRRLPAAGSGAEPAPARTDAEAEAEAGAAELAAEGLRRRRPPLHPSWPFAPHAIPVVRPSGFGPGRCPPLAPPPPLPPGPGRYAGLSGSHPTLFPASP
jgi:hypothetical protein